MKEIAEQSMTEDEIEEKRKLEEKIATEILTGGIGE